MQKLLSLLFSIPSKVWTFYVPILKSLAITGAASLLPLALEIVQTLAHSDKTGAQKREAAFRALRTAALERGVDATESLLRWTVESAVQRMKADEQI
jgi:hypothetical protein